jgi:hypothetical protein
MKQFKFFSGTKRIIDWSITGLLEDSANPSQLIRALNVTLLYLDEHNLIENTTMGNLLLPIMTRIYRNKFYTYEDFEMRIKIEEIVIYFASEGIRQLMDDLSNNAYSTIDVEAETCAIIAEKYDWDENL